ncbi:MAG: CBS domain-containing protein [Egibacteraceae bacterium]
MTASGAEAGTSDRAGTGIDVKVGDLASGTVLSTAPDDTLREAAKNMDDHGVGSVVVLAPDGGLAGILTERDLLRCVATDVDLDDTRVRERMTADVVTAAPDWEVYEAAAEMTDRHIRHLVVVDGDDITGVLSIRDLLLAGQRIELTDGGWAVLRDPLTFSIRERRRLQKHLIGLDAGPPDTLDLTDLIGVLVASWSPPLPLPADADALAQLADGDRDLLRRAVLDELPALQRAVQPAPGWRSWRT